MPLRPLELIRKLSVDLQQRPHEIEEILDVLPIGIAIADDPLCSTTRMNRALHELIGGGESHASLRRPSPQPPLVKTFKDGRQVTNQERPMYQAATRGVEVSGIVLDLV